VAEPVLNSPRVVAGVRQSVAAAVAEHVGMCIEREASALANALDEAINGIGRERAAPLAGDDKAAVQLLAT
jgi:hypothetical protein